jgi:hypothetical protein
MKHVLISFAAVLVLAGCSSAPDDTIKPDLPSSYEGTLPEGSKGIGPVILGDEDTSATVEAGSDTIVFDLSGPSDWSATLSPQGLATFQAGSDDSTMVTNPTIYPLKEGVLNVVLTNNEGRSLQYVITITAPSAETPAETGNGMFEDAAAASEAFGLTILGMFEVDAIDAIEASGRVARVAERDGEGYALTKEYNPSRLNLVIVTGLVSSVYVG